jgi:hypothetical protein
MSPAPTAAAGVLQASRRDLGIAAIVVFCISVGLYIDGDATRTDQYLLGVIAWCFLAGLLAQEPYAIRVQVGVAVVAATVCEYSFAPLYHIYTYRFDNVPAYVPPGHGMVYLAAVSLARSTLMNRYRALACRVTLLVGGAWALWGVTLAERLDTGGAALYLVFAAFVMLGRSPLLYVSAFYVTSYLELAGTYWGTWAWAMHWPSWGGLAQANPPSGIAAGYCFLDTVALAVAPLFIRSAGWVRVFVARLRAPSLRLDEGYAVGSGERGD